MKRAYNFIDRGGSKINNWHIVEYVDTKNGNKPRYLCRCDCGTEVIKVIGPVLRGVSKSCGCKNRLNHIKHGFSNTMVYNIWAGVKNRCLNKNAEKWDYYGGRGILICDRWKNSFHNFFEDMGYPPTNKHSIERINNNGNYEPGNCKWATKSEQALNRRPKRQPLPEPPLTNFKP